MNESKYLGVTIQSNLKWKSHVLNVSVKANCILSLLRRNLRSAPKAIRELSYISLVRPVLEYACPVWCPWLTQDINQLEKVQRRAARFVADNYSPYASVSKIIDDLQWTSLEQRRYQLQLCLFYKMIHRYASANLDPFSLHQTPSRPHTRSVRSLQFQSSIPRTDIFKFSFCPRVIRHWNNLPEEVISSTNLTDFKSSLNNLIVNLYH